VQDSAERREVRYYGLRWTTWLCVPRSDLVRRLTRQLLARSEQAFTLALEIFNKPTIRYRIEGFCFFYTNAWELLAKARLIENTRSEATIFHKKKRGQPRRSLSLRDVLARVVPDQKDAVRRNVEEIADLRDHATHLLIPELEAVYAGLFQAGVFNYVEQRRKWFPNAQPSQATPPLLSLVWESEHLEPTVIQKRHGRSALAFMQERRDRVQSAEQEIADRRFSISIEYKLVLTKKPKEADITLGAGPGGAIAGQIIEVPKDVSVTHPYTHRRAVAEVQKRLGTSTPVTTYDFQAAVHVERIKKDDSSLFHYLMKQTGTSCYSESLIDHIVQKIRGDSGYLKRVRETYRKRLGQS
jgi:hypothetical protein